jgi:hypothetical protein
MSDELTCGGALGAFAIRFLEEALAHADDVWRHFHQLVAFDESECLFEREFDRRREDDGFVRTGGTDVGQLLFAQRVDLINSFAVRARVGKMPRKTKAFTRRGLLEYVGFGVSRLTPADMGLN